MTELPLIFGVIAITIVVMLWLLVTFRRFFRLREERAPEVVTPVSAAGESPPGAPSKAAPAPAIHRREIAA